MSIKENIEYVKQELSAEENFFESFLKIETFYKKYRRFIQVGGAVVILGIGGNLVMSTIEKSRVQSANEAYATLQASPSDAQAMAQLQKESPSLFEIHRLQQALTSKDTSELNALQNSTEPFISKVATYQLGLIQRDKMAFSSLGGEDQNAFRNLALLMEAYMLLKEGDIPMAKLRLASIPVNSPVKSIANMLDHYTVKGGIQ